MLAQSIIEYGGLAVVVEQMQALGYELSSWMHRTIRQDALLIGGTLTGLLVMLRLLRAR